MSIYQVNRLNLTEVDDLWYIDNGATHHVTCRKDLLQTFELSLVKHSVTTPNRETVCAQRIGIIKVEASVNGKRERFNLVDVW